jgi:hypothetical protein
MLALRGNREVVASAIMRRRLGSVCWYTSTGTFRAFARSATSLALADLDLAGRCSTASSAMSMNVQGGLPLRFGMTGAGR